MLLFTEEHKEQIHAGASKPAGDELLPSVTYFVRLLHLLAKELGKDIRRYYCEVKRTVLNYSRMVF